MKRIVFVVVLLAALAPVPAPALLLNLSTRVFVPQPALGADATSVIGGFIIGGDNGRKMLLRAIGPSLGDFGLAGLANPTMELHDSTGAIIASNDDWKTTQKDEIDATGLSPTNPLESAILMVLPPGSYTAVVRGVPVNGLPATTSGTVLIEVYDISLTVSEGLVNSSTRASVQRTADPMITGFIIANGDQDTVVLRALGPSLVNFGLVGLADPRLDLYDGEGNLLASNDNWQDTQSGGIAGTGLAPSDPREAAILITLPRGAYTAVLSPVDGVSHGVALAELYKL